MVASEPKGHGQHAGMWVFPDASTTSRDLSEKTRSMPQRFTMALMVTGLLFIVGIVGFAARAADDGFDEIAPWGYYMAVFSFVFMISSGAPLVVVAFRFTKSHWRRPISRIGELFSIVCLLNLLMFIPLMFLLPDLANPDGAVEGQLELRRTIWFEGPIGAPHAWDLLGVAFLAITSLAILWTSAMPDMAESRGTATGFRGWVYKRLSSGWYGTPRQWDVQKAGLALLGAFYFMTLIFVHFEISSDYAQSLIPGWKDSIFPVIYSVTALQMSLGAILVVLFIMRRWGGYEGYAGKSVFWSASKVLLGVTLLWIYHMFAFFITFWYGRLEVEQNIIQYLITDTYGIVFLVNALFSFLAPFALLIWNPVRRSDWGPALAGVLVIIGGLAFCIRIFVGAANAAPGHEIYDLFFEHVPAPVYPDIWDVFMVVGGIGAAIFVYLVATKMLPLLSLWEIKEGTLYQKWGRFMKGEYLILGKPE
ncbi:MAG: polysulfide reductase NrfD [Chloroflexi bacterium]|nr:polysulfide reductase NrfD [Chloroflexota bacterium]